MSLSPERLEICRRYREKNREKVRASQKKYQDANKEKIAEYHKQHYALNRDKILSYGREYEQRPERKAIRKEQKKQYYQQNKVHISERNKRYQLEHAKHLKEKAKEYKAAHPEVTKKAFEKYNKTDKAKQRLKRYDEKHPNRYREKSARQRVEWMNRTPAWADKEKIKEFYDKCPNGMVVDHIIPLRGKNVSGFHVHTNLQYLTPKENSMKLNKFSFEEYKNTNHYAEWLNTLNEAIEKFKKD
jgi:hypothetical protein